MRTIQAAAAVAMIGMLTGPVGLAAAQENAEETIADLQSRGFAVTVNRIGSAPLNQCVVTNVRESPQAQQVLPLFPNDDDDFNVFQQPQQRSAIVTVNCSR